MPSRKPFSEKSKKEQLAQAGLARRSAEGKLDKFSGATKEERTQAKKAKAAAQRVEGRLGKGGGITRNPIKPGKPGGKKVSPSSKSSGGLLSGLRNLFSAGTKLTAKEKKNLGEVAKKTKKSES